MQKDCLNRELGVRRVTTTHWERLFKRSCELSDDEMIGLMEPRWSRTGKPPPSKIRRNDAKVALGPKYSSYG